MWKHPWKERGETTRHGLISHGESPDKIIDKFTRSSTSYYFMEESRQRPQFKDLLKYLFNHYDTQGKVREIYDILRDSEISYNEDDPEEAIFRYGQSIFFSGYRLRSVPRVGDRLRRSDKDFAESQKILREMEKTYTDQGIKGARPGMFGETYVSPRRKRSLSPKKDMTTKLSELRV